MEDPEQGREKGVASGRRMDAAAEVLARGAGRVEHAAPRHPPATLGREALRAASRPGPLCSRGALGGAGWRRVRSSELCSRCAAPTRSDPRGF